MTDSVFEAVRGIAADVLDVPAAQLTRESSPEQIDSWDSVQHLNLILACEERFGISINPEDMSDMTTLGRIATFLEARRAGPR